mmetsp:Transcript_18381/g.42403  ORF Transcript_18381/g.42403 Transcript_18381/m.42403 type:complete len:96 (+) Transcript_18381:197-484(+)
MSHEEAHQFDCHRSLMYQIRPDYFYKVSVDSKPFDEFIAESFSLSIVPASAPFCFLKRPHIFPGFPLSFAVLSACSDLVNFVSSLFIFDSLLTSV